MEIAARGKKYRVIEDSINFFKQGEIVVSLEDSDIPFCVKEEDFKDGFFYQKDYDSHDYSPLDISELEEVDDGEGV